MVSPSDLGAAIVVLTSYTDMTLAQVWKALHHEDTEIPDVLAAKRAEQVKREYLEHFPPSAPFTTLLELNNLGRYRVVQTLQDALLATRWCPHQKKYVPDIEARIGAIKLIRNGRCASDETPDQQYRPGLN